MSRTLHRRLATATAAILVAFGILASPAAATQPPKVMAALGDSITRAFNSDGPGCPTGPFLDCPKNSWSTGTNPAVDSQFQRLEARSPGRDLVAHNDAVSRARAVDLLEQAEQATNQDADYVTIEIGANDACGGTSLSTFRTEIDSALEALYRADPKVYVEMLSIPDINELHTLFTNPPDPNALTRWQLLNVCQALLANPLSVEPVDVARRAAFRENVIALNRELGRACGEFKRCRYDGGAVFDSTFTTADVANVTNTEGLEVFPFNAIPVIGPGFANSTADYFHPSLLGQAQLAQTSWESTFPDYVLRKSGLLSH